MDRVTALEWNQELSKPKKKKEINLTTYTSNDTAPPPPPHWGRLYCWQDETPQLPPPVPWPPPVVGGWSVWPEVLTISHCYRRLPGKPLSELGHVDCVPPVLRCGFPLSPHLECNNRYKSATPTPSVNLVLASVCACFVDVAICWVACKAKT